MMYITNLYEDYFKITHIVDSCKTEEQLGIAKKCCELFLNKWYSHKKNTFLGFSTSFEENKTYQNLYFDLLRSIEVKQHKLNDK